MLIFKSALISLTLGTALVLPTAALACNHTPSPKHDKPVISTDRDGKTDVKDHDKSVKQADTDKHQKDDSDHSDHAKPVVKSDRDDSKHKDVDKHDVDTSKSHKTDNDEHSKDHEPKATPAPVNHPTPSATPVAGKGSVLASSVSPAAVVTSSTLPVTGSGAAIALAVAAASSVAAYQLTKRRA